ncbi:MAG: sigma 54-interacting transcriptional regulator [Candidatus Cloacimonetes bacterium]|nr:sigma 54-interacting transcriptional regulator [Candidatus Cloacimonadota bacterium]MCF7814692.1 sigma 54-interacting transcriptional regulator [Candidatus Cloacimonadota bacterium]MCF7869442.1 sigma 54-interacting transcriptional regulator [Candidatus Cloacimonadota bacterium]MCF7884582.1 sigma 54-interacting transcriptional regulator [Candidatus Cloacimonadota bacterium]
MKGKKMRKYFELLTKLKEVGKTEKFAVYQDIFITCFINRDDAIFQHFDDFLDLLEEFIAFDSKPELQIKNLITQNFEILFHFIRSSNNSIAFEKYHETYLIYKKYFTNFQAHAKILQYLGYIFWLKQNIKKSIIVLEQSLHMANKYCDKDIIPNRYTNLGYIYECSGDFEKAQFYYQQGLDFAKNNNSEEALKFAYDAMGRLFFGRELYQKAILYFEESIKLYHDDKHLDKVSVTCNLASSYMYINKNETAKQYFNQINKKWIRDANPELYYSIIANSAINEGLLKNFSKAENSLLDVIQFAESNNTVELLLIAHLELGIIYLQSNQYEKSSEFLFKALEIADSTQNEKQLLRIYTKLALVFKQKKEFTKSIIFAKKAGLLSKKQNNLQQNIDVLKNLSDCYEEEENYKQAYLTEKEINELQEKMFTENRDKEEELEMNPLIGTEKHKHYIFRESNSLISMELAHQIGTPFIGRTQSMLKVIQQALLAAANSYSSVLIRGESGTGKEIVAKLIHYSSSRASYPFVAVNSASFNPGLVQSALFGHVKGAFTGASTRQIGHFEAANQGTIFFDEIGEMPLDTQTSLLRVLEEKKIKPIGSHKEIIVDFRLISATNRDVYDDVKNGKFRLDFLNRVNTLEIVIPPLRERKDDIPILVEYFLEEISGKLGEKKPVISVSALKMLCDYDYPGNVRELRNTLEKLILFSNHSEIGADDIYLLQNPDSGTQFSETDFSTLHLETLEKNAILKALKESDNVKTEAAKLLGITSYALLRRIKKYNLFS